MASATARRILSRWNGTYKPNGGSVTGFRNNIIAGGPIRDGLPLYSGSQVDDQSADFLGDWRAADSWQRFDMWRVRNRSRQLERGNPWVQNFLRVTANNVLGHRGFHCKVNALTSRVLGDNTTGIPDTVANGLVLDMMKDFGRPENFTTRKKQSRKDVDRNQLVRLIIDGEIIFRKIKGFDNDYKFAWQIIDPDYLDQNLNRVEPNGNIIKMGVELDATYKFPVAYWFLHRRPNDYFYNYNDINQQRYERVPAADVLHIFMQSEDSEQTRGWPWIFAAMLNLWRMNRFEEAALLNATIGASKTLFYSKEYPDGFIPGEDDGTGGVTDHGYLIDRVKGGTAVELPYGVKPMPVDMRYPDAEFEPFQRAMLRGSAATFGTSYATTSGDLSDANFVSSRLGQLEEREQYMSIQEFFIEKWKVPAFEEELYRAILAGKINLPMSKFSKFNAPIFTGRRWPFVQPVDDMKGKELMLNNRVTSISAIIEEQGGDPDAVFAQIAADEEKLRDLGIARVLMTPQSNIPDPASEAQPPPAKPPAKS